MPPLGSTKQANNVCIETYPLFTPIIRIGKGQDSRDQCR